MTEVIPITSLTTGAAGRGHSFVEGFPQTLSGGETKLGGDGGSSQPRSEEKKPSCRSPCSGTGQNNSNNSTGSKPEPLVLKIDERQRLARERREEQEKQIAVRESAWQERAERAKQYYEKHLEERRQKLEEQRLREERRRTAVEEKRRQRLEEDKVRHEAVMRRTLERSQRANQKPNRWSWGGALQGSTAHPSDADRRSVSTANLSKHAEPIITKRLSSSSATLLNSPDRALQRWTSSLKKSQSRPRVCKDHSPRDVPSASRRLPLTPWESSVSAASLSGEAASCHPGTSTSFRTLQCRNGERPRAALSSLDSVHRRRSANPPTGNKRDKDYVRKSWSNLSVAPPADVKRSWCPGNQKSRATLPSPVRANHKAAPRPPTPKRVRSPPLPQAPPTREEPSSPGRPLSPGNVRPVRAEPQGEELATPGKSNRKAETPTPSRDPPSDSSPPSVATPPGAGRLSAGTTDPEEATRLLAEKRRQAREQREREEEERRLREETERRGREEMARRKAEERARREEEAQRLAEERRKREEEGEEEEGGETGAAGRGGESCSGRVTTVTSEQDCVVSVLISGAVGFLQKEEEEARQREEDERLRLEREKHFQKEEAERLERKKRLEEIMKRTRRSEPAEKKSVPHRNGEFSEPKAEVTAPPPQPTPPSVTVTEEDQDLEDQDLEDQDLEDQDLEHVDRNGHRYAGGYAPALPTIAESTSSPEARPRENGVPEPGLDEAFEEVISLPVGARLVRLEDDDLIPVVAFRENGSLRPLASVEDVQARQRAGR
ncbi:hypothetical protein COCON_G00099130 [Conger conger]|uniref:Ensconsin n=1 Tax=Conger conger TaxID=82655 RepID=A0A9Q1I1L3_CONCO|nr:hypothetical protein COCON_G00099130 [Conger conger]